MLTPLYFFSMFKALSKAVIHLVVSSKHDRSSVFRVHGFHVKVNTLKLGIRDSKHDFLYITL